MSIADLRLEYSQATLSEHEVDADPIRQFANWFDAALAAEIAEPNAMNLATIGKLGRPSARIVLLKDFDARGFTWYTNYSSRKGQDLLEHPYAAITFHWGELERQIRIEGTVERVTDEENDSYFSIRPIKSRLGAIASAQSMPIESRELLEQQFEEASEKFGETPPRPAHWGGYRLKPDLLEFWQGRRSRLHDRVLYTLDANGKWQRSRLQP
ncbi:MAG: pyridoxamine 5'-phosphate oxidase [Burkholderiales bacterium]|jgi:pyridoxamine 5'-phosphate oxidase|nr:pyridoxamine 5'-phosphate oxidase [Burkholderiales bacterium]